MSAGQVFILGVHLATVHIGGHDLEPINPGVYVRTESGLTAGVYRNSYGQISTYAGLTLQTDGGRFALTAGAVTGYPAAKVMPLLAASVRVPITDTVAARISLLPKPLKGGTAVGVHLSIERSF